MLPDDVAFERDHSPVEELEIEDESSASHCSSTVSTSAGDTWAIVRSPGRPDPAKPSGDALGDHRAPRVVPEHGVRLQVPVLPGSAASAPDATALRRRGSRRRVRRTVGTPPVRRRRRGQEVAARTVRQRPSIWSALPGLGHAHPTSSSARASRRPGRRWAGTAHRRCTGWSGPR